MIGDYMKSRNILLISIIVLLLAILGVISYYTFFKEEEKPSLNKDSYIAMYLQNWIQQMKYGVLFLRIKKM